MKSLLLFFIILFFNSSFIFAQSNQWKVYNTSNSGIPHNKIDVIQQDANGNYWIGTRGGLAKFDGESWTTWTPDNSNIKDDLVSAIVFDGATIWIGYAFNGIAKFDGVNFTNYDLDDILNTPFAGSGQIKGMDIDNNHNLWIATYNGLIKYDGTTFVRYHNANGLIGPDNRVWSIKCDRSTNNIVWVGTFNAGLLKFDGTNFTQYFLYDPNLPFVGGWQQVNKIIFDQEGDIWVTGLGCFEFDKNTMALKTLYNSNNGLGDPLVWGIAFDQTGKLWVGSDCLDGVFCLDNGTWLTYNETNSGFPEDICYFVFDIYVDNFNNVWMAHGSQGVVVYNEAGNVGVSENEINSNQINIYPNPSNGMFTLANNSIENVSVQIMNMLGETVYANNEIAPTESKIIDFSSFAKGVYTVDIVSEKGESKKKIVIQ